MPVTLICVDPCLSVAHSSIPPLSCLWLVFRYLPVLTLSRGYLDLAGIVGESQDHADLQAIRG